MKSGIFLGIEIGGTKLQLGIGRGDGKLIALGRRSVDPARGGIGIREQILEAAAELRTQLPDGSRTVDAVGIGFGGPVDAVNGAVTVSNQIQGWAGFPLADWVRAELGVTRVALQNDADTAALGEARFGAGVGASPVLYVTVGSGIGGGLIIDGKIYRGAGQGALEIGHLRIDAPFPKLYPDHEPVAERPLELIASGWSIGRQTANYLQAAIEAGVADHGASLCQLCDSDSSRITGVMVSKAAEAGDVIALAHIKVAANALAKALGHAVTLLAPERIILGGGVSLMSPKLWLEPIRKALDSRVFGPFRGSYEILPPLLGEEVVVHGALALASDLWQSQ
jgi:glucokinase